MNDTNPFAGVAVLIPAYNPDQRLVSLVDELMNAGCRQLIVVNDGSQDGCREIFEELRHRDAVVVCDHAHNKGKGAALKTGFSILGEQWPELRGVVTADADGQHLPADIARLAGASARAPDALLLGCRSFGKDTPLRSLLGNRATAFFMTFVHGIPLTDTQTGLRYIPARMLPGLILLKGNGYEFELECLIESRKLGYKIAEVPITTVYIDGNESSHFMPIADSIRIYSVLFRFGGSSIASFGVDIGLFALLVTTGTSAVNATIAARIISGIFNFSINKILVFERRSLAGTVREAMGYFTLWLFLMFGSASAVWMFDGHRTGTLVAVKVLADISLFVLSYYIQSRFVFTNSAARKST